MKVLISDVVKDFFERNANNSNIVLPLLGDLYKMQNSDCLVKWKTTQRAKTIWETYCGANESYRFYAILESDNVDAAKMLRIILIGEKASGKKRQNIDITTAESNVNKYGYTDIADWPVYMDYVKDKAQPSVPVQHNVQPVAPAQKKIVETKPVKPAVVINSTEKDKIIDFRFRGDNLRAWLQDDSTIKLSDKKDFLKSIHNIESVLDFAKNNVRCLTLPGQMHIIQIKIDCPNNRKKRRSYAVLATLENQMLNFLYWKPCLFDIRDADLTSLFETVDTDIAPECMTDIKGFEKMVKFVQASKQKSETPKTGEKQKMPKENIESGKVAETNIGDDTVYIIGDKKIDMPNENIDKTSAPENAPHIDSVPVFGPVIYSTDAKMHAIQKLESAIKLNKSHINRYELYMTKSYEYLISNEQLSAHESERIEQNRLRAESRVKELKSANYAKKLAIKKMYMKIAQNMK